MSLPHLYRILVSLVLLILCSCTNVSDLSPTLLGMNCDWQIVNKVYDGDTVRLQNGNRVRYIGIDALEMNVEEVPPFAIEALQENEKLVLNKRICLTKDTTSDNEDKYGRLLRYVYLEDGTLVNQALLEMGLATAYLHFLFDQQEIFSASEEKAREKQVGMWKETVVADKATDFLTSQDASNHYNEYATVRFFVASSHDSGKAIFLNSETNYQNTNNFTAVIFYASKPTFIRAGIPDPASYYLHQAITVQGEIKKYQGRPEIIVSSPNQVTIQMDT